MEHLNQDSILFDENSDVARLNTLLDHLCERKFADPKIAISCFRKVMEIFGVMLPILDIENEQIIAKEFDFEETFKIENVEKDDLYFYITIEKDEDHPGLYEAWAQIVDKDELDDLEDEDDNNNNEGE